MIERGFAAAGAPLDDAELRGAVRPLHRRLPRPHRRREPARSRRRRGAWTALAARGADLCVCTNKLTDLSVALLDALDLTAGLRRHRRPRRRARAQARPAPPDRRDRSRPAAMPTAR